jgi:hypothetical protein
MLALCELSTPPHDEPDETQRKQAFVRDVKEVCEVAVAKCQDYLDGDIDDWGMDETLRAIKSALRDELHGVEVS